VKNILGHASIQSTQVYVEITQQTVDKHMKEWNDKWFPKEETEVEMPPNIQSSLPAFLQ
jgi:integrase